MLAQDFYSGALYDVPEMSGYGEVPFDGLGAGFNFGNLLGSLLPGVGNLIGGLFGGGGAPSPAPPVPPLPIPSLAPFIPPIPPLPFLPQVASPIVSSIQDVLNNVRRQFQPPPWVPGWTQPAPWVNRRAPRSVYMRCGVWPGQPGLVPVAAANQMLPVNGGAVPAVPLVPAMMGGGRRHHHYRRR